MRTYRPSPRLDSVAAADAIRRLDVRVPGGEDVATLVDDRGEPVGRVVRRR